MVGSCIKFWFYRTQFNPQGRLMVQRLRLPAGLVQGKVLDVGAGESPYRHLFRNASGYIRTNTMRHYEEWQLARMETLTDFWIEDGSKLPFDDAEFDCVCAFQVLSVVEDGRAFFREAARVMKPGSALLISTDFLYPSWSSEDYSHFTAPGLRKLASEAGFEGISVESFGSVGLTTYMLWQNYLRSYAELIGECSGFCFLRRLAFLPIAMILSPLLSIVGWMLYILERSQAKRNKYAFNLLLKASLSRNVPGSDPGS
jgi:SAM-dependent methyltransferase